MTARPLRLYPDYGGYFLWTRAGPVDSGTLGLSDALSAALDRWYNDYLNDSVGISEEVFEAEANRLAALMRGELGNEWIVTVDL
jgi:hypothetical protein